MIEHQQQCTSNILDVKKDLNSWKKISPNEEEKLIMNKKGLIEVQSGTLWCKSDGISAIVILLHTDRGANTFAQKCKNQTIKEEAKESGIR